MAPEELLNHGSQFLGHGPRRVREAFGHVLRPGKLKALLEEKLKANALLKTPAPARQTETRQCRREREGERERETSHGGTIKMYHCQNMELFGRPQRFKQ